jgi:hypothetical protein
MFCHSIIAYTFSSTKLEIRAEQILTESEGVWRAEGGGGGIGRRNGPNNVCTYE